MRRLSGFAVVLGLLGLVAAGLLWWLPANEFIFVPDVARPLESRVTVEGARPGGKGDVYYVDLFVRRARLLERLLPFTRPDGSTIVPERALLPPGTSEQERDRQNVTDMRRSEKVAAVVALRTLGYDVVARPRGVLVTNVASDVPAIRELNPGDVVVAVGGTTVTTPAELRREIGRRRPGDDVRLTIRRDGGRRDVTVRLVANPSDPSRPVIGIQVDQAAQIELPVDVNIDLGQVGGPSAGLPFALEIARLLGRDVTHGCKVAATGALALDGTVIPIGGIEQKTIGARRAGVDFFLVPAGANAEGARENADGLPIIPVESFQQAFHELTTSSRKC